MVAMGSRVSVDYTGRFEDGTVFDSSEGREPIQFVAGEGHVIKGFDDAVIGMRKGESKKVTIMPENGYGSRDEKLQQDVPRSVFPPGMKIEKGMGFSFKTPTGELIHASITGATPEMVTLDMNHPLAGKSLVFELKVVEIA
ncbi:peptidylprolyl isomerase [Candidatus Woesearchaeota archaeon]|nr:peptidylprolyl isomerase [Candidatus Woesearchaeota archaeon]